METNAVNPTRKRLNPSNKVIEDIEAEKKTKKQDIEPAFKNIEINNNNDISKENVEPKVNYYGNSEHALLKELFLVEMPVDFFKFYEMLNADGGIEKTLASVNLELIGPYDLLLGRLPKVEKKELYLVHGRYFDDPPEFQAVLKKKKSKSQYHIGYFRDAPNEMPAFVGSKDSAKNCRITILADNIFGAVYQYLQNERRYYNCLSMTYRKLMDKIKKCAEENNFTIDNSYLRRRKSIQATNTLHHAGIVLHCDRMLQTDTDVNMDGLFADFKVAKTPETKDEILSQLKNIICHANSALDQDDFVTALELGIGLFSFGEKKIEPHVLSILTAAYSSLNRHEFNIIIRAHMKYRRQGAQLSSFGINTYGYMACGTYL